MKKYFIINFYTILIMLFLGQKLIHAYPEKPHKVINEFAAKNSILANDLDNFLYTNTNFHFDEGLKTKIGDKEIVEWIKDGGAKEDESRRPTKHFHDPLEPWEDAGLKVFPVEFMSSLIWAQKDGDDIWGSARNSFYMALITGQNVYYIDTFLKIGQIMHLVSDNAVPPHVRNDQHLKYPKSSPIYDDSSPYEKWINNHYKKEVNYSGFALNESEQKDIFSRAKTNTLAPCPISALWDQDAYTYTSNKPEETWSKNIGLAEFTNANFFSKDTIDKYPNPVLYGGPNNIGIDWRIHDTVVNEKDQIDNVYYYKAEPAGIPSYRIAVAGYITHDLETQTAGEFTKHIFLDDNVFKAYADILVPRAVGYSAAVIDYFFRGGSIEISPPDNFIYATIDGSIIPQQFTYIKAKLRNTSDEEMENGTLRVIAKYKKRTDYEPDLSADPPTADSREENFSYSVSDPIEIVSLSSIEPEEFAFEFSDENAIPAGITDLYLQVVFRGTLGDEADTAVIISAVKDINEPQHVILANSTDRIYYNGILKTAEEFREIPGYASLLNIDDIDPFNDIDIGIVFYPDNTPANLNFSCIQMPASSYGRAIILADAPSFKYHWQWSSESPEHFEFNTGTLSGVVYQEDSGGNFNPIPQPIEYRGIKTHFVKWVTFGYPNDTPEQIESADWPPFENDPLPLIFFQ